MTVVIRWLGPALAIIAVTGSLGIYLLFTRGLVDRIPGGQHWHVHWTERNRVLTECRGATVLVGAVIACGVPATVATIVGRLSAIDEATLWVVLTAAHSAGILWIAVSTLRSLRTPELTVELSPRERVTTVAYWFVLGAVLIAVWTLGSSTSSLRLVGFVVGAALLLWSQWRSDVVRRRIGLLLSAPTSVQTQAALAGMERSQVLELRATNPNAFALPSGHVAVTTGLLSVLSPQQIQTILRHESAHIAESRINWVARIIPVAVLISLGPLVTMLLRGADDIGALLVVLLGCCGLLIVLSRIQSSGRTLEAEADHHAAEEDPHLYARSLETLYRVAGLPATHRRGSHPPLYDRLLAAGMEPDYPRPDPPGSGSFLAGLGLALVVNLAILATPAALIAIADEPLRTEISIAVGYDFGTGPATLAAHAIFDGDSARADEILGAATDGGYDRTRLDIALTDELAVAGFCDEAGRRLADVGTSGIDDHPDEYTIAASNVYWYCA